MTPPVSSVAAGYDRALRYSRDTHLPPSYPTPQPTKAWPPDNIQLLAQYQAWLIGSGVSPAVVKIIYIPSAGHVLGYHLKPYAQLDLDRDFACVLEYLKAKQVSAEWLDMNRNALRKFRRFLEQQRGQRALSFAEADVSAYTATLPDWLVEPLRRYQHLRQANWRPARRATMALHFWSHHARLWRWLLAHDPIHSLDDLKRQHILAYVDMRLAGGYAAKGINQDLRALHAFLLFLQDQDWHVPQALLRVPALKEPEPLPRFLSHAQVSLLRADLEQRVSQAQFHVRRRDALLDRAAFYLLWQAGLRLGEVEEVRLDDLDLPQRMLMVRQGKGRKDRAVFLTDTTVAALQAYLAVRGQGPSAHVFLYRAEPLHKDLIRARIKACGARVGVAVTPHQLRHTFATQLLNAGCKVTTIQKLLGHRRLNATLVYARVHDQTVSADYYAAMARIEQALELTAEADETGRLTSIDDCARAQLLVLVKRLAEPQLEPQTRLGLVGQMRRVLDGATETPAAIAPAVVVE